jgi:type IV pilus assembly protein PilM
MTRLPVEMGDPFVSVTLAKGIDAEEVRKFGSALTVALGLALGRAE